MPTVIDSLCVELSLDPKGLTEGQKKALQSFKATREDAAKSAKEVEASGKRAAEGFFGKLKSGALELFAVMVGAGSLTGFLKNTAVAMTDVSNASRAMNVNTRDTLAFGKAIEAAGGNASRAQADMINLKKVMEDWSIGRAPDATMLQALMTIGANPTDSPEEIVRKASVYAANPVNAMNVRQVSEGLGFGQSAEIVEFKKGPKGFAADLAAAMGRTPETADIEGWRKFWVAIITAGQSISGYLQSGIALTPDGRGGHSGFLGLIFDALTPVGASAFVRPTAASARVAGSVQSRLASDLGLTNAQAAGIVSNLLAESGMRPIDERSPLVPGSRGGVGYAQWTGGRRNDFEAWAAAHGLNPHSDEASYGYLVHDLMTRYRGALASVKDSRSATGAAQAFFRNYEGGYDPRLIGSLGRHLQYAGAVDRGAASVTIGSVVINTQATDATGIARTVKPALSRAIAQQANRGLTG